MPELGDNAEQSGREDADDDGRHASQLFGDEAHRVGEPAGTILGQVDGGQQTDGHGKQRWPSRRPCKLPTMALANPPPDSSVGLTGNSVKNSKLRVGVQVRPRPASSR